MRTKYIIKDFQFVEENRARLTIGTDTRLHPTSHWLQLKAGADGKYPDDDDLEVKTWVANPLYVKQWAGFQVEATQFKNLAGVTVTSMGFRLGDGTDEYWWDGAVWDNAPAAGEWNTEEEISGNIATFPVTELKLQVIINLKTTDEDYTPRVHMVKVLYTSVVEFQEDILYRSLVRELKETLRPIADYRVTVSSDTTTLDLTNDFPLETPYEIDSIDSVFNHTDDPNHLVDLYQSYDSGTKVITLSTTIPAGEKAHIRFVYQPDIMVFQHQEFTEIRQIPLVAIQDIRMERASPLPRFDWVINKHNGQGKKLPYPLRGDITATLRILTDKGVDLYRLADACRKFFQDNPTLRSRGLDEEYRLWLVEEFVSGAGTPGADLREGSMSFRIVDVLWMDKEAEDVYDIRRLILQGDMNAVVE